MDYGKFKYDQSKNAKQTQKVRKVKEVKLRPKTEKHDFDVKLKRARKFIEEGHKVLVTMVYRGREQRHPEIGREVLLRFFEEYGGLVPGGIDLQTPSTAAPTTTASTTPTRCTRREPS